MSNQEIQKFKIKDLVLWTENPRDPINVDARDQDVVDRALKDRSRWKLNQLAKSMGDIYDFSEIPIVVLDQGKPIVYDGNRRMILAKIKFGLVNVPSDSILKQENLPNFPEIMPCNVCSKEIALKLILRKHSKKGSWLPLDRDIFLHKFMGEEKSIFLILDEKTNIITDETQKMNQRFVKDEIFREDRLEGLGFKVDRSQETLLSIHSEEDALAILKNIQYLVKENKVNTRASRGNVIGQLESSLEEVMKRNKDKEWQPLQLRKSERRAASSNTVKSDQQEQESVVDPKQLPKSDNFLPVQDSDEETEKQEKKRQARRVKPQKIVLFGKKRYLKAGEVSNLYRDLVDLYEFYEREKESLSSGFPNLVRMGLRLLCETAASSKNKKLSAYIQEKFAEAKKRLTKDEKTTLANQNVTEVSIVQLLQTGAHTYTSSDNIQQTLAISLIVGEIITLTHGQD